MVNDGIEVRENYKTSVITLRRGKHVTKIKQY